MIPLRPRLQDADALSCRRILPPSLLSLPPPSRYNFLFFWLLPLLVWRSLFFFSFFPASLLLHPYHAWIQRKQEGRKKREGEREQFMHALTQTTQQATAPLPPPIHYIHMESRKKEQTTIGDHGLPHIFHSLVEIEPHGPHVASISFHSIFFFFGSR